jgi:glycosyltransferase involved in cell wall biosynthesis
MYLGDALARLGHDVISCSVDDEKSLIKERARLFVCHGHSAAKRLVPANRYFKKGMKVYIPTNDISWWGVNKAGMEAAFRWHIILPEQPNYVAAYKSRAHRLEWFPWSTEPRVFYPEDVAKTHDVVFVGTLSRAMYRIRKQFLTQLAGDGFKVWRNHKYTQHDEMRHRFNLGKVCFHMSPGWRPGQIGLGVPYRTFEVMGCGGVLIINRNKDVPKLFHEGEHYFMYDGYDDLKKLLKRILPDKELLERVGRQALEAVLAKHTVDQRAKRLFGLLPGGKG